MKREYETNKEKLAVGSWQLAVRTTPTANCQLPTANFSLFVLYSLFILVSILLLPGKSSGKIGELDWHRQKSGGFSRFSAVFFIDRKRGWITGSNGAVMVTEDGGESWNRLLLPERQKREMVRDLWVFKDGELKERMCFLGEYGIFTPRGAYNFTERAFVLMSSDRGESWSDGLLSRQPYRRPDKALNRVTVNESGKVQPKETDDYQETLRSPEPIMVRMFFVDDQVGWTCGESGAIQTTKDGGANWSLQYTETRKLLYDVMAIDRMEVTIVGAAGTVLHTDNGGQVWEERKSGVTDALRAVYFIDAKRGWAVGANGTVILTIDGGKRWQRAKSNTTETLNDVVFVSANEGWIAGNQGILLHTLDGGITWEGTKLETHANMNRLCFIAPDCGWVVGTQGVIYKYGER
ncbi:MAG: YCF48-related protein [Acidobacteria bacterium]|nr:YCF48-related protein [Acidobacteriota bacterium]